MIPGQVREDTERTAGKNMSDYNITNYDNDEIIIDVKDLVKDIISCISRYWLIMLLICVVSILAGVVWKRVSYEPVYQADTVFTIILKDGSRNASYEYVYNTSAENMLEKPLDGIVASHRYRETIMQGLGINNMDEQLTLSSVSGTNQFRLTASGPDPDQVLEVLDQAVLYFPEAASDTVGRIRLNIKQEPTVNTSPSNAPDTKTGILYGGTVGMIACMAIIFVYAFRRLNCVHKETDLKEMLGVRSYGMIIGADPDTVRSAVLRLQKELDEQQKKVLLVEGTIPDAENAKLSLCLARMLALSGKRVLVIDSNLASPNYSERMTQENAFSKILEGDSDWRTCICRLETEGIDLVGNSKAAADYSRQISADILERFVEEAKAEYDYVLFTAPGKKCLCAKEAVVQYAGGFIYVMDRGIVNAKQICEDIDELSRANAVFMGGIFYKTK